jgi:hypothetical protein
MTVKTYQKVVDHTLRWLDYSHSIRVIKRGVPRGEGFPGIKLIILPTWIDSFDVAYRLYYVLHELVHCMVGIKHDITFMKIEDVVLAIWDIRIVRKKIYPKVIFLKERKIKNIPK